MKFRADIQILRGLAVLYVVLFHLGIQSIQSGFLGVDVFFVISGFLMAVLYDSNNIKDFFARRAKRLLPAYYVTLLATLGISFLINTPNESNQVASQAIFGSAFLSNIGFWSQNSYFSKSEFNPLLHLWSLGVEIQFYAIVPVIAFFFRKTRLSIVLFFLASISLCFLALTISPKTSFFMMPLRAWEFLLGYACALFFTNNGNVKFSNHAWLGATGLALIIMIPFLSVNGESLSIIAGHPGLTALLVSIATSVVLVFGLPRALEQNFISHAMVTLGKYSYSVYLVHFPIIVLYLSAPFSGTVLDIPSMEAWGVILILIVAFSILLHKFVETRKFGLSIWKISVAASSFVLLLAIILPWAKNSSLSEDEKKIFNAFSDRSPYRCGKLIRILEPNAISCRLTGTIADAKSSVLLVGNSHADAIKSTFVEVAADRGVITYFIVQNNPLMSGGLTPENIVNEAKSKGIRHIVFHSSPRGISISRLSELASLSQESGIKVTFIDPVPTWKEHVPRAMYFQIKGSDVEPTQTKEDYLTINAGIFSGVKQMESENFKRIAVVNEFCNPNCLYKSADGTPLYFDEGHLTLTGSRVLQEVLAEAAGRSL